MNKSAKVILLFFSITITIVLTIYITFAWFNMHDQTKPIVISTGSLRVSCSLYRKIDLEDDLYEEIIEGGFPFENVIPGQIYTFKMIVRNEGTVDGFLEIKMNDIIGDIELLSGFTVSFINPSNDELVEINLDDSVDGKLILFSNYVLGYNDSFLFDFYIIANSNITRDMQNKTLIISNYIVSLVQYH